MDIALYADVLAAKAADLSARLERVRGDLRQVALEREAKRALEEPTVVRLERLGLLGGADPRRLRKELFELAADLAALRELQTWTEARLRDARSAGTLDTDQAGLSEDLRTAGRRPRVGEREVV